jgi:hypothetical protein
MKSIVLLSNQRVEEWIRILEASSHESNHFTPRGCEPEVLPCNRQPEHCRLRGEVACRQVVMERTVQKEQGGIRALSGDGEDSVALELAD